MLQKNPIPPSYSLQIRNSKAVEEAKELLLFLNIEDRIVYKCKNILSNFPLNESQKYIDCYMLDLKNKNEILNYKTILCPDGVILYYKSGNDEFNVKLIDFKIGENNG